MHNRGFTLIELLITITIVSVLSTIGFVVFFGVLPLARDSKRISDLNKLATALEIYAQRNNGKYVAGSGTGCGGPDTAAFYDQILEYMSDNEVPKDPKTKDFYCYVAVNNGQSYRLYATLENCQGSGGNLCSSTQHNHSVFSNDLILSPPP